jgi:hypothetical protein
MAIGLPHASLYAGLIVGFAVTLAVAQALNEFGDVMFKRGVAKPFFIGGHRLHHRDFLFVGLPAAYALLSSLVMAHFVKIVWSLFWTGLAGTIAVAAVCLTVDLAVDYAREGGGWGVFHHELIYLAIPLYVFSNFLRLAV